MTGAAPRPRRPSAGPAPAGRGLYSCIFCIHRLQNHRLFGGLANRILRPYPAERRRITHARSTYIMDTRITQDKFATVSEAEIYAAAQQARAEFLVELLFSAGRGLRRAGHWLGARPGPGPGAG